MSHRGGDFSGLVEHWLGEVLGWNKEVGGQA
jgi:hypothetical protein